MELLIKKAAKILSFSEDKSALFQILVDQLGPLVHKIGQDNLLASMQLSQLFTVSTSNSNDFNCWIIKLNDEVSQELNHEHLLSFFWKEEFSNLAISTVYRFIYQSGSAGIPYVDLASKINSFITITGNKELKTFNPQTISHYCRKLLNMKFIIIKKVYISRIAIATKFIDKDGDQIDVQAKRKMHKFDPKQQDDTHDNKTDTQIFKIALISDPWNYLKEDTFILRELTFTQNILLIIASYEAYLKEGYLQTEVAWKINKIGEVKMLFREFDAMVEMFNIIQTADRKGRSFFLKYQIRTKQMANFIDRLLDDKTLDYKSETDELMKELLIKNDEHSENNNNNQQLIQSPSDQMYCQYNQDQDELDNLEKQPQIILSSLVDQLPKTPFNSGIKATPVTVETLFSNSPRLNNDSFTHIYNYFKEHQNFINDSLNAGDKQFIEKYFIRPPNEQSSDYIKLSEMLLHVIHCSIEFNLPFLTQQAQQHRSNLIPHSNIFQEPQGRKQPISQKKYKKQISKCKLQRYIFILNMVNEKKVFNSFELKSSIIKNEHSKVKIDKKTIERIMNTFQYLGYVQIIKKVLPYQVFQQNIKRYIFVHKDVVLNDQRVIKAENTITNGIFQCFQKVEGSTKPKRNYALKYLEQEDNEIVYEKGEDVINKITDKQLSVTGVPKSLESPLGRKDKKNRQSGSKCSSQQLLESQKTQDSQETKKSFCFLNQRDNIFSRQKINYCFDEEEEDKQSSQFNEDMRAISKKTKLEFVIKEEEEVEEIDDITGQSQQQTVSLQKLERFIKVNYPQREASTQHLNLSKLLTIIFQALSVRTQILIKGAFMKIYNKQRQQQFYSQLCSDKLGSSKNPLFQENLCKNFQSQSSSISRQINSVDLGQDLQNIHESEQSYEELEISQDFTEKINLKNTKQMNYKNNTNICSNHLGQKHPKIKVQFEESFSFEKITKLSPNQQDQREQINQPNNQSKFKTQLDLDKENICKLKNFFLQYPSNSFSHLMNHFSVKDFFSFLSTCTSNGSMKLFLFDSTLPRTVKQNIELVDIQSENLDQIYYQITPQFQEYFKKS